MLAFFELACGAIADFDEGLSQGHEDLLEFYKVVEILLNDPFREGCVHLHTVYGLHVLGGASGGVVLERAVGSWLQSPRKINLLLT